MKTYIGHLYSMGHYSYEHLEIQDGGQPPSQMKKIAASQQ